MICKAEIGLLTSKSIFLHIFTKSVEPIFQNAGPISEHQALEETLHQVMLSTSKQTQMNRRYPSVRMSELT